MDLHQWTLISHFVVCIFDVTNFRFSKEKREEEKIES